MIDSENIKKTNNQKKENGIKKSKGVIFVIAILALLFTLSFILLSNAGERNAYADAPPRVTLSSALMNLDGTTSSDAAWLVSFAEGVGRYTRGDMQFSNANHIRVHNQGFLPQVRLFETVAINPNVQMFSSQMWDLVYITHSQDGPIFTFWMNGVYRHDRWDESNDRTIGYFNSLLHRNTLRDFNAVIGTITENAPDFIPANYFVSPGELAGLWQTQGQTGDSNITGGARDSLIWNPSEFEARAGGLWQLNAHDRAFRQNAMPEPHAWLRSGPDNPHAHGHILLADGSIDRQVLNSFGSVRPAVHINLGVLAEERQVHDEEHPSFFRQNGEINRELLHRLYFFVENMVGTTQNAAAITLLNGGVLPQVRLFETVGASTTPTAVASLSTRMWDLVHIRRDAGLEPVFTFYMSEGYRAHQWHNTSTRPAYAASTLRNNALLNDFNALISYFEPNIPDIRDFFRSSSELGIPQDGLTGIAADDPIWIPSRIEAETIWGLTPLQRSSRPGPFGTQTWLRSGPAGSMSVADTINIAGGFTTTGLTTATVAVRPAVHLTLNSLRNIIAGFSQESTPSAEVSMPTSPDIPSAREISSLISPGMPTRLVFDVDASNPNPLDYISEITVNGQSVFNDSKIVDQHGQHIVSPSRNDAITYQLMEGGERIATLHMWWTSRPHSDTEPIRRARSVTIEIWGIGAELNFTAYASHRHAVSFLRAEGEWADLREELDAGRPPSSGMLAPYRVNLVPHGQAADFNKSMTAPREVYWNRNVVRSGFSLVGWYQVSSIDDNFNIVVDTLNNIIPSASSYPFDFLSSNIVSLSSFVVDAGNIVFVPVWRPIMVTVGFEEGDFGVGGGHIENMQSSFNFYYGENLSAVSIPQHICNIEEFAFLGFWTHPDVGALVFDTNGNFALGAYIPLHFLSVTESTASITLYARWARLTVFTITIDPSNTDQHPYSSNDDAFDRHFLAGSTITAISDIIPTAFTRMGFVLSGWEFETVDAGQVLLLEENLPLVIGGPLTPRVIRAVWTPIVYNVVIVDADFGQVVLRQDNLSFGAEISIPIQLLDGTIDVKAFTAPSGANEFSKLGHSLYAFTTGAAATMHHGGATIKITPSFFMLEDFQQNLTINLLLVPVWAVNQYTVSFEVQGEIVATTNLDFGENIPPPEILPPQGHRISGWRYNDALVNFNTITVHGDMTLTAVLVPVVHRVIDNVRTNIDITEFVYLVEHIIHPPHDDTRDFIGWTLEEGSIELVLPTTPLTAGLTLIAVFNIRYVPPALGDGPTIAVNIQNQTISWTSVAGATRYRIYVGGALSDGEVQGATVLYTTATAFSFSHVFANSNSFVLAYGVHTIRIRALDDFVGFSYVSLPSDILVIELPQNLTAPYSSLLSVVQLPDGWAWVNGTQAVGVVGQGYHNAVFTHAGFYQTTWAVSVLVTQSEPPYILPTGLEANFNSLLSSVTLPDGWAWESPANLVGNVIDSPNLHWAVYTPQSSGFTTVRRQIALTVVPIEAPAVTPTGIQATFGDTLQTVLLPDGWAWQAPLTTEVGLVGSREFTAIFTPADTDNFTAVSRTVIIAVARKSIAMPSLLVNSLVFNAAEQTVVLSNPSAQVSLTGRTSATSVATYFAFAELLDTENLQWQDGSTTAVQLEWQITPLAISVIQPTRVGIEILRFGDALPQISTLTQGGTISLDSGQILEAGSHAYTWTFTPLDTENFAWSNLTGTINIQVLRFLVSSPSFVYYEFTFSGYQFSVQFESPSTHYYIRSGGSFTNAGTHTAVIALLDESNFEWAETGNSSPIEKSWTIHKARHQLNIPLDLTADSHTLLLNAVAFPTVAFGTWEWLNPTDSVGPVGENWHQARFTPSDTNNFEIIYESVPVAVAMSIPNYSLPQNLTATFGDLLHSVELPFDALGIWEWVADASTFVGNAGSRGHMARFIPHDGTTYLTVTREVTIQILAVQLQSPALERNNNIISWAPIDNATHYAVSVYQNSHQAHWFLLNASETSFNVFERLQGLGIRYGTFIFEVTAIDNGFFVNFTPSEPSEITVTRLKSVEIVLENSIALWQEIQNASGYRVEILRGSDLLYSFTTAYTEVNLQKLAIEQASGFGNLSFRVIAVSEAELLESEASVGQFEALELVKLDTVIDIELSEDGVLSWTHITNHNSFAVYLGDVRLGTTYTNYFSIDVSMLETGYNTFTVIAIGDNIFFADSEATYNHYISCNLCPDCDKYPCECPVLCIDCDKYPCECPVLCIDCDKYPCECPVLCIDCDKYPCECPELCPDCDKYPCECPELCIDCDKYPCECPELCPDCDKYPCECPELCPDCDKYPCECPELCPDCDKYPCECYIVIPCPNCGAYPCTCRRGGLSRGALAAIIVVAVLVGLAAILIPVLIVVLKRRKNEKNKKEE